MGTSVIEPQQESRGGVGAPRNLFAALEDMMREAEELGELAKPAKPWWRRVRLRIRSVSWRNEPPSEGS